MSEGSHRLQAALSHCELCPRRCGVNRLKGEKGFCGAGVAAEVYRYGAHHGEEPPVSGVGGSGTVFFSRCTMRCLYCQNYPWSQEGAGTVYDADGLTGLLRTLAREGCVNWNLVSPTPWLPQILHALERVKEAGERLPVVYNTSGFERVQTLESLAGEVDVFLVDLRYASEASAAEGSCAEGYVQVARDAVLKMWELAGPLKVRAGCAVRGVICRLLILPGRAGEAVENLRWLAEQVGTDVSVSIMAQYVPVYTAAHRKGWERGITRAEYDRVCREAECLDFQQGWIQDFEEDAAPELIGCKMTPGRGR